MADKTPLISDSYDSIQANYNEPPTPTSATEPATAYVKLPVVDVDIFFEDVYYYYSKKGYMPIVLSEIVGLLYVATCVCTIA